MVHLDKMETQVLLVPLVQSDQPATRVHRVSLDWSAIGDSLVPLVLLDRLELQGQQDSQETKASPVTTDFLETLEEPGYQASLVQLEHLVLKE